MTSPAYEGVGTVDRRANMSTPLTPTCPATVNPKDLLLAWITNRSNASEPYTLTGVGGWVQRFAFVGGGPQIIVQYRIADGTEGGQTVTCTTTGGSPAHRAAILRFSGVDVGGPIFENIATGTVIAKTVLTGIDVTSNAADRLAVNLLASNGAQSAIGDLSGMTGGTWDEVFFSATDENPTCSMQVANLPGAGKITGGSVSGLNNANFRMVGFSLIGVSPEQVGRHDPMRSILAM